ncbi:S8 family serine peptidase [Azospirillum sp. RWY-5-1]|uniref:S8 family serine peptidase n=1 Tax=Azospirillum oleiclasticum TaxID=2735135 RepID=A0ABX2TB94_9PROT|nr:S8 family serine peptidase [Azospirillum oleiclasticum]NYZ15267.1 S8 family serine peptidase [Azospirillum oleiclasticum]NYZ21312.1 S8 family serine peptidase [Azospirillum oleiclasticum]
MAWSVAVLDQGISNWFERTYRRNLYEYDVYWGDRETDYGVPYTHGTYAAMAAWSVNPALDFIDLRVMSPSDSVSYYDAEAGLSRLITLSNQGYGIGAVNLSWGGPSSFSSVTNAINELAGRGIYAVAASGNHGNRSSFDTPFYPASMSNVIAVGAHDGTGTPVDWSQNDSRITVLADGTDVPVPGINGTSFAAPQVASTVATLQAYARYGLGRPLTLAEMKDSLQLGGNGPRSAPDPADGRTRYFLHTHQGSVDYFVGRYLLPSFDPLSYIASYSDLTTLYGTHGAAGLAHFLGSGAYEGRAVTFDGLSYLAANLDVADTLGVSATAGAAHYLSSGRSEGRRSSFDHWNYLAANPDLIAPLGTMNTMSARHYLQNGRAEQRPTAGFDPLRYIASYGDLIGAYGLRNTAGAVQHYVTSGRGEGRQASFDAMGYLAVNRDLLTAFGIDTTAATRHYIANGYRERRVTLFDSYRYLASNTDLIAALGTGSTAAAEHYVRNGIREGRGMGFSAEDYLGANLDLALAFGSDSAGAIRHYVQHGWREGRQTRIDPAAASVSESSTDLPANSTTSGRVAVGGTVTGRFTAPAYYSDTDWFRIRLLAGQGIQITLTGRPTGALTIGGQYLALYHPSGWSVAYSYGTYNSNTTTLTYTAPAAGDYHIAAQGYVYPASWNQPTVPQPYTLAVTARRSAAPLAGPDDGAGLLAAAV